MITELALAEVLFTLNESSASWDKLANENGYAYSGIPLSPDYQKGMADGLRMASDRIRLTLLPMES